MTRSLPSILTRVIALLVIAFVGFTDAVYLTASHYVGSLPVCAIVQGCDEVALSTYATIGPIPVALLGVLFYVIILISGVAWLDTRNPVLFRYLPFLTVPAFLFSMWLIYLMFFVLEAVCIYCLISAVTTTLIMLLSFRLSQMKHP
ncbi:MAG: vitamin K epoxide reductase family protein [Balneolales bacterium]